MADAEIEIEHELTLDEAVLRLERLFAAKDTEDDLLGGLDFTRTDERFSFSGKVKGFKLSGEMEVFDRGLRILVFLPWAARPFRESANKYIREYFETNLA
ncbi:MAG: polyhydroxyalkanoic acid system family protein [Rhodospirillales bacterium]